MLKSPVLCAIKINTYFFDLGQICCFKTKRRKLHFKEFLFLTKNMKTCLSKKFWFYFIIFKYFLDNSLKNSINFKIHSLKIAFYLI